MCIRDRVYSNTAQSVVDNMILSEFVPLSTITIATDFANEAFVRHSLDGFNAKILSVDYGKNVMLNVEIAEQSIGELIEKIGFYGEIKNDNE